MANGNIEVTIRSYTARMALKKICDDTIEIHTIEGALNRVPDFVHINMYYDSLAHIWIVALDGRSGGCEDHIIEISNMSNNKCLHELILEITEIYERKFIR